MDELEFEWIKCTEIAAVDQGWKTVCSYRLAGFINNGKVTQKN